METDIMTISGKAPNGETVKDLTLDTVVMDFEAQSGNLTYKCTFQNCDIEDTKDGKLEVVLRNTHTKYVPQPGDSVTLWKGPFSWMFDGRAMGLEVDKSTQPSGGKKAYGSKSASGQVPKKTTKDDYFNDRATYEREVRDPKIEIQTWAGHIMNIMASNTQGALKSQAEINDMVDFAVQKAKDIISELNKKNNTTEG